MKQLLLLSGKGGTGKTTIAGAFIALANCSAFADCDVDAPNLHLIAVQRSIPREEEFYGMGKAVIDADKCTKCGLCRQVCRFGAIIETTIDQYECEGCGICLEFCPAGAISLVDSLSGKMILYNDEINVFSTAILRMGSGNSGKLVSGVKKQLLNAVDDQKIAIIDGSPGIGCPVIASLSGVEMVLIVAEPSFSGISDMERILKTAQIFHVKIAVCINKWDSNPGLSQKIENYCKENQIDFVGKIPFDETVVRAVNCGKSIAEYEGCAALTGIKEVFKKTIKLLYN